MDQPCWEDLGEVGDTSIGGGDQLVGEVWVGRSPKGTQDTGCALKLFDEWGHNLLAIWEVNEEIRGLTPIFFPPFGEGDLTSVLGGIISGGMDAS